MTGVSTILQDRGNAEGPVLKRTPLPNDQNLDITPMIDDTFLLLIFFLVAPVPDVQAALDLPERPNRIVEYLEEARAHVEVRAATGRQDADGDHVRDEPHGPQSRRVRSR